jgi:anti-sigma B factor antagonist
MTEGKHATMKIRTEVRGHVAILYPAGRLAAGGSEPLLREQVAGAVDDGARHVIVDLAEVSAVDSTGVGELVSAHTAATNRRVAFGLTRLPPKLAEVLGATGLGTILPIYTTLEEAIAGGPSPAAGGSPLA